MEEIYIITHIKSEFNFIGMNNLKRISSIGDLREFMSGRQRTGHQKYLKQRERISYIIETKIKH